MYYYYANRFAMCDGGNQTETSNKKENTTKSVSKLHTQKSQKELSAQFNYTTTTTDNNDVGVFVAAAVVYYCCLFSSTNTHFGNMSVPTITTTTEDVGSRRQCSAPSPQTQLSTTQCLWYLCFNQASNHPTEHWRCCCCCFCCSAMNATILCVALALHPFIGPSICLLMFGHFSTAHRTDHHKSVPGFVSRHLPSASPPIASQHQQSTVLFVYNFLNKNLFVCCVPQITHSQSRAHTHLHISFPKPCR